MTRDCNCRSFNVGGIVQHQSDCESWNDPTCEFCGAETKEFYQVTDRGEKISVCEACYKNNFIV